MSVDAKQGPMNGEAGAAHAVGAAPEGQADAVSCGARLPYRKPELRRLGSVRELTLGGTRGMTEGAGSFMTM